MTGDPPPDAQDYVWTLLLFILYSIVLLACIPFLLGMAATLVVYFFKLGFRSL